VRSTIFHFTSRQLFSTPRRQPCTGWKGVKGKDVSLSKKKIGKPRNRQRRFKEQALPPPDTACNTPRCTQGRSKKKKDRSDQKGGKEEENQIKPGKERKGNRQPFPLLTTSHCPPPADENKGGGGRGAIRKSPWRGKNRARPEPPMTDRGHPFGTGSTLQPTHTVFKGARKEERELRPKRPHISNHKRDPYEEEK